MKPSDLILALDVATPDEAVAWVDRLGDRIGCYKVGLQLFTAAGPDLVRELKARKTRVFLDLKLHDIPNTVARAVESAIDLNVDFLTLHACGGPAMCRAAAEAADSSSLQLLGVTVLTALQESDLHAAGVASSLEAQVLRLARLAVDHGVTGLVCSPLEVKPLREQLPPSTLLITPGVRPPGADRGDQARVATPQEAMAAGASAVVIGRPILQAHDPEGVLNHLLTGHAPCS